MCQGKCDGSGAETSPYLHCWVKPDPSTSDPSFAVDELWCSATQPQTIVLLSTVVEATDKSHSSADLMFDASSFGQPAQRVARFYRDKYPIDVTVENLLTDALPGSNNVRRLSTQFSVTGPDEISETSPELIAFPFRLEPLTLQSRGASLSAKVTYELDLGSMVAGELPSTTSKLTLEYDLGQMSFGFEQTIAVPYAGNAVTIATSIGGTDSTSQVPPGTYRATAQGIDQVPQAMPTSPLADCWTTSSSQASQVDIACKLDAVANITTTGTAAVRGAAPVTLGSQTTTIATVDRDALPVTLDVSFATASGLTVIGAKVDGNYVKSVRLTSAATADTPESIGFGFQLWPVTFVCKNMYCFGDLAPYDLELGVGQGPSPDYVVSAVHASGSINLNQDEQLQGLLAAPADATSLSAMMTVLDANGQSSNFTANLQQGSWSIDSSGVSPR
jgi:hypothetical protein